MPCRVDCWSTAVPAMPPPTAPKHAAHDRAAGRRRSWPADRRTARRTQAAADQGAVADARCCRGAPATSRMDTTRPVSPR